MSAPASSPLALEHLFHPDHTDRYADAVRRGVDELVTRLGRLDGRPATGLDPARAAAAVAAVDLDTPLLDLGEALDEVGRLWLDDAVWFHEPRYAAHLNCPVVIPALLAEALLSAVNPSLDTFDQSVGATSVERHLVDWTAGRIGFGADADGIFTSGGTQSNLQALLLARDHALETHPGATLADLRIVTSVDGHFSVQKAARLLGLGDAAVRTVPVDSERRMVPGALSRTLSDLGAAGLHTAAVVATAGTTDFGAIDPLPVLAELAHLHGAWLHVDAAYGGGLLASPTRRHLLAGIERADSVTVDFHKTWFQPVSSSAVIVAERHRLRHVTWHADYLNPAGAEESEQVDKSLQTTRRFDALKLWLTLRVMGADEIGRYVDAVVDLATEVGRRVEARDDLELAADPQLSTVVWRPRPDGIATDEAGRLVPLVRAALYARGSSMVAATKVDGEHWLKFTLLNPMAKPDDIVGILDDAVALARGLAAPMGVAR